MNRICFRVAIARPSVGFDYFGSWNAYHPAPILEEARRELARTPDAALRLQCTDSRGKARDLGWNPEWLKLLDTRLNSGTNEAQWSRAVAAALLSNLSDDNVV